jgi:hypothetical protein
MNTSETKEETRVSHQTTKDLPMQKEEDQEKLQDRVKKLEEMKETEKSFPFWSLEPI